MKLSDIQTLVIEPTTYCNAKCAHCPRFDVTDPNVFESTGTLHAKVVLENLDFSTVIPNLCLDRMSSLRTIEIEGDKGDPLMHPNINTLLDAFASMQQVPTVQLTTNGSIRNPTWWQNLAKTYPFLIVRFSIDGLDDTNHLYRVGLNFNTIIKNLVAFTESGGRVVWKMLIFKHNQHQIKLVEEYARQTNCEAVHYVPCDINRFKGLDKWPVTHANQTHFISPPDIDIPPQVILKRFAKKFVKVDQLPDKICPWGKMGNLYIGHQGHVLPCCSMHYDTTLDYNGRTYLEQLCQGFDNQSLLLHDLETILNNPLFNTSLEQSLNSGKWHNTCTKTCKQPILKNMKKI